VAVSKGIWAVKLCSNKILQFLTGAARLHTFTHIMARNKFPRTLYVAYFAQYAANRDRRGFSKRLKS